jgi:hypothetical protein
MFDLKRFQMDSVRGVKYLVPVAILMCVWSLAGISAQFERRSPKRNLIKLVGLIITIFWVYQNPPAGFIETGRAWARGRLTPQVSRTELDTIEAVKAVKKLTAPGSRILPIVLPLEIRYADMRPIVYAYKDGGIFADTNLGLLLEWDRIRKQVERIGSTTDPDSKIEMTLNLAKKLKADYALTDFHMDQDTILPFGVKLLWRNRSYALLSVDRDTGKRN